MIQYIGTNEGDVLGYPDVLRVTFGAVPHFFVTDNTASAWLARDIASMIASLDSGGYPFAVGSDPQVPPGAQAVTIDFAPLDSGSATPIATILSQLLHAMGWNGDFIDHTVISRVEKMRADRATGSAGAIGRGNTSADVEKDLQTKTLGDELATFFEKAGNVVMVGAVIAGAIYFAPVIKRMLQSREK